MAIEKMMIDVAPEICIAACASLGEAPQGDADLLAAMKRHKGTIGATLAREFVAARPFAQASGWPEPLRRLAGALRDHLATGPRNGEVAS